MSDHVRVFSVRHLMLDMDVVRQRLKTGSVKRPGLECGCMNFDRCLLLEAAEATT